MIFLWVMFFFTTPTGIPYFTALLLALLTSPFEHQKDKYDP